MLNEISNQLDSFCRAYKDGADIGIWTHMYLEGDPINFRFHQEDNKFSTLTTGASFSEWMAYCTGNWKKASPTIHAIADIYGVVWDDENGSLSIRFRRNEMSIAQAVMRLQQAVAVICTLGPA